MFSLRARAERPQEPFRNIDAQAVRALLTERTLHGVNLVDVREPEEFETGHIPGATLIPLGQLPNRLAELDPSKPTVVYCKMGGRGMAGAGILAGAGFADVSNLNGGIGGWDGQAIEGAPEAGWTWFAGADSLEELLEQAWLIEEGAALFYARAAELVDADARTVFEELAAAEQEHKGEVENLYRKMLGREPEFDETQLPELVEGGLRLSDALRWLEGKDTATVMEMAMALEATAFDRYAQLSRLATDDDQRAALKAMTTGEQNHLEQVTRAFARRLAA